MSSSPPPPSETPSTSPTPRQSRSPKPAKPSRAPRPSAAPASPPPSSPDLLSSLQVCAEAERLGQWAPGSEEARVCRSLYGG
ncbi:hypothetical protein ACFQ0T_01790 [Kitasatospora gansuensis]